MDISDYYKECYSREVSRKSELTSALSLPLGILSLLIGGTVAIAKGIHFPLNRITTLELALMAITGAFILLATYYLVRSYYNYEYGYAPSPLETKRFRDRLIDYYVLSGDSAANASQKADVEVKEHIDAQYAKHGDRNFTANNRKSAFLHKANGTLIVAIVSAFAVGAVDLIESLEVPPPPQKVAVVSFNLKEFTMPNSSKTTPPNPPLPPKSTPAPAPTKPTPPEGPVLKEHVDPRPKN